MMIGTITRRRLLSYAARQRSKHCTYCKINTPPAVFGVTNQPQSQFESRRFSSSSKREETEQDEDTKESVEDTIHRLAGDQASRKESSSSSYSTNANAAVAVGYLKGFVKAVGETWDELMDSGKPKSINKSIRSPDGSGGNSTKESKDAGDDAPAYDGPSSLMIVDEELPAWEKLQRRIAEAPIIKGILGASHKVFEQTGINDARRKLGDIGDDAREAWETSQNPWVYRLSSVWDTVTAESEFAIATRELNRLDPEFTLVQFKSDLMETLVPEVMQYFLEGNTKALKPMLGEAVYNRLSSEIRIRKQEGLVIDPNILSFDNDRSEILACQIEGVEKGSPIILFLFSCQQINCVRNKDGEVVEGGEDEIRANAYVLALQREYDEENGSLIWKVVDFTLAQSVPWI
eukprot:CAMPEP_0116074200 /NCGR_PEP_ID=MMETSP0322-20121206/15785_1 /TAXON_ID=163516 /ORGANISM="Leptocylindrus danicus var. apora, Strain B651" /LENGTH=403 /DNA_ID=CAMNT_0003563797 /DNA_START=91 /DNA_END=1302 /DNA_ORIENTATION=-